VDEINSQSIFHHSYVVVRHPYITIKIVNLHNDTCQMKNVWKFFFTNKYGSLSSIIILDNDTCIIQICNVAFFENWEKLN